jgi:phosphoribosylaminoimidazole-succinocarboxamide synthase
MVELLMLAAQAELALGMVPLYGFMVPLVPLVRELVEGMAITRVEWEQTVVAVVVPELAVEQDRLHNIIIRVVTVDTEQRLLLPEVL